MLFDGDNTIDVEHLLMLMATVAWTLAATLLCSMALLGYRLMLIWLG